MVMLRLNSLVPFSYSAASCCRMPKALSCDGLGGGEGGAPFLTLGGVELGPAVGPAGAGLGAADAAGFAAGVAAAGAAAAGAAAAGAAAAGAAGLAPAAGLAGSAA